jgi:beta-N-acetylhexosaminidase
MSPAIYGLSGPRLTPGERAFFRDAAPAGFILFARNCIDRAQLRALTDDLRALAGRDDLPILIDQEGGRVTRLRPPEWPDLPGPDPFGRLYGRAPISGMEAMRLHALAIGLLLREVGVTVNCMPMLDLAHPGAHPIIATRALGHDPLQVAALGRAALDGMAEVGVVGVVKHMPGHGRASADSHSELPVVGESQAELEADLAPFRSLNRAPIGMTAHVVYQAWDAGRPATLSPVVIGEVIRGRIGFDGLLISDDIGMAALSGGLGERARAALAAGCDLILHCSGELSDIEAVAEEAGDISSAATERLDRAMAGARRSAPALPYEEIAGRRDSLLAYA